MAKFEIEKSTDNQYFFRLRAAADGRILLKSETYTTKAACKNGLESVKKNAPMEARYDKLIARNGTYYFNLKAGNGEPIGTSNLFPVKEDRDKAIQLVKEQAPDAAVFDLA